VFHHKDEHKDERIRAHVQLCWLALLILRVAKAELGDTWCTIRDELERLHLVTRRTAEGTIAQRSELTARHKEIFRRLRVPEPARFHDFTPLAD
jgi:transposase